MVKAYRAAREEEQRIKIEEEKRLREEYDREVKLEIERNRVNVERRGAIIAEREEERKRRQDELNRKEEKRRELLAKMAEQCSYWENVINAKHKLDHITAATETHKYIQPEAPARGYMPRNGLTSQQVLKDARVRIAFALREAGVAQSGAAKMLSDRMFIRANAPI